MCHARWNVGLALTALFVALSTCKTNAQVCQVSVDGAACVPQACSAIPEDVCLPDRIHLDFNTGALTVFDCQCRDFNVCHIEFGNASPFAAGYCPDGSACQVISSDTDNDGIADTFAAACRPTCCDASLEPGTGTNPICVEGYRCCLDGVWRCNQADGSPSCGLGTGPCCCDPAEEPGTGSFPPCVEGHTCCADGTWQCNQANGLPACDQGVVCPVGPCCLDIDDGPVPYDTCVPRSRNDCEPGGVFGDPNVPCGATQACCLSSSPLGMTLCADLHPSCCLASGGNPQGAGTNCQDVTLPGTADCPEVCGGLAGIPCSDPNDFCKTAPGECCCDIPGVCVPKPQVCTEEYNPVCGCDGHTYPNPCHAAAAGVSIEHLGVCTTCCDPRTRPPSIEPVWCCADGQWLPDDGDGQRDCPVGVACGACCVDPCLGLIPCPQCIDGVHPDQCNPDHFKGEGTICGVREACCASDIGGNPVAVCFETEPFCCAAFAGAPLGPNSTCVGTDGTTNNACEMGLCCTSDRAAPFPLNLACEELHRQECLDRGGVFQPGLNCDGVEACCFQLSPVDPPLCVDLHPFCCEQAGGRPNGTGSTCQPDPIACGGIAGLPCPPVYICVDDPNDNCDPNAGGADCIGVCVPPDLCGGIAGIPCPDGFICVDDPTDNCDPSTGGADCSGICAPQPPCPETCGGLLGIPCDDPNEFCKTAPGQCCCDFPGVCTPKPGICPDVWDPVCGCDGNTYGNECEADAAGVPVDHFGLCGTECVDDSDCVDPNQVGDAPFCKFPEGTCGPTSAGGLGVCTERPIGCPDPVFDPVCGCDGNTYGNECEADLAGVSIRHRGECVPTGACCFDFDDGPVPFDTCLPLPEEACAAEGGVFGGMNISCEATEACCLAFADAELCADLHPFCCLISGGVPQGPGSTCQDEPVPATCGGFAGLPCPPGFQCIDNPNDGCDPNQGGADCPGICVPPAVQLCNDNAACPTGFTCVDDPTDNCLPNTGVANCPGICVAAPPPCGEICGGIQGIPCNDPGEFCKLPVGACCCDHFGLCVPTPQVCPDVWNPVCGCDGNTYGNECEADASGVSIDHVGMCRTVCTTDADCETNQYCHFPDGTCGTASVAGECMDKPEICPLVYIPVCGCDGVTYGNKCEAAAAGVSILHEGPCEMACGSDADCPAASQFCKFPTGSCGTANVPGVCTMRPPSCDALPIPEPVCGCDGNTYGSECEADMAGVSVRHIGPCLAECLSNADCPAADRFCKFPGGTCGAAGVVGECTVRPGACPENYDPVCGCDGTTYGNECEADAAGVSVRHRGPCEIACTSDADCDMTSQFCKFPDGTCGEMPIMLGICTTRPVACTQEYNPVCGCDGNTYGNPCMADMAGVSIRHYGPCEVLCGADSDCPANHYCKFSSCDATIPGVCTLVPGACPENYDPVCGCDGVTYANECFADMARASVAHVGECEPGPCAATRIFEPSLSATPWFCPGTPLIVHMALKPPDGTIVIAVEDAPPPGWEVIEISHGGTYDETNHKVKWGPFFAPFPERVTYAVKPGPGSTVLACFDGTISVDGINEPVCGVDCLGLFCPHHMEADIPQPACPNCPVGDCLTCDDGCRNGRIALCELIGYACAWKTGCNDDLAGVTRAAYIWKNGECYCWNAVEQNWFPNDCPPPVNGLCSDNGGGAAAATGGRVTARTTQLDGQRRHPKASRHYELALEIEPPPGTTAVGLEVDVPFGWTVSQISDGGKWDADHRKIKWGPFMDNLDRSVSVALEATVDRRAGRERHLKASRLLKPTRGTVSFDGVNQPVSIR